ncbi:MAG: M24 family metallopeptidase [Thermomicrobiales bacterium]
MDASRISAATLSPSNEELAKTRAELRNVGADFALLSSIHNVTYASGWEVPIQLGAGAELAYCWPLLLISARNDGAWLIVPDGQLAGAKASASVSNIFTTETLNTFEPTDPAGSLDRVLAAAFAEAGLSNGRGVFAVEARTLPLFVSRWLSRVLPRWVQIEADVALQRARWIKTAREIALLRNASRVSDAAQQALTDQTKHSGLSEFHIFAEITRRSFAAAGRHIPLSGELVTGPRTTTVLYPNGPRDRFTEAGDAALMDLSGRVNGYWFDCTNIHVIAAEPTAEQRRYGRAAVAACEAAMAALKPGARASDAFAAAEAAFASFGLPMAHYAGHQIGVTVNEFPRLVPYDDRTIEPGMVFSVEPGAYHGEGGTFGARAEKMVLVTESGPEILSDFAWGIN